MVMLELEALGLDRVRTQVSVQYVDHNLLQADERNMADHLFLRSACQRFGVWYSRPGNGVSHPVHMQRFGRPGASLAGSDSHTCAAGSLGMLAIGVGGLIGALISGAVITEQIFGIAGFGRLTIESVQQRDYTLIQGIVLVAATGESRETSSPCESTRATCPRIGSTAGSSTTAFSGSRSGSGSCA